MAAGNFGRRAGRGQSRGAAGTGEGSREGAAERARAGRCHPPPSGAERSGARSPGRSERRSPDRCGPAGAAGRERRPRSARCGAARTGRGSPGGRLWVRAFCLAAPAGWENKLLSDVARGHRVQVENPSNSPLGVFLGVVSRFLLGSGWFVCFLFCWLLGGFVVVLVFLFVFNRAQRKTLVHNAEIGDLVAEAGIQKAAVAGAATLLSFFVLAWGLCAFARKVTFYPLPPPPQQPTLLLLSRASAAWIPRSSRCFLAFQLGFWKGKPGI